MIFNLCHRRHRERERERERESDCVSKCVCDSGKEGWH